MSYQIIKIKNKYQEMKTLHLLLTICLLATSVISAQNNSEKAIKKSKATIDSIVSSEKEMLKKKLSAVNELLKDRKITEEMGVQIKEELNIWQNSYANK